ncbi:MAG: very short patch repair endonuclease [Hyphomicrobiales bacterium]|nr:very short patch repair endonuclease [Hyphomicrobiales bacterium]
MSGAPEQRSRIMRAVKDKDTSPELIVRRLLHHHGYRFRLHRRDLPGKPDLVFPARRKVIFVHGCFWHGHDCKRGDRIPKTNTAYWTAKIDRNRQRDRRHRDELRRRGWQVFVIWECQLRDKPASLDKVTRFLDGRTAHSKPGAASPR